MFRNALSSTTIVTTTAFNISGRSNGSFCFAGNIDQVSAYNKTLSSTEVAWIYNAKKPRPLTDAGAPSNLAAWWRMGDGDTFPTILDSGPSGYTGTMTNMEVGDIVFDVP